MNSLLRACLVTAFAVSAVHANNFSFTGSFITDDEVQLFSFTLADTATVTFQTYGYGGGFNAAGTAIPTDGFESVLTWFGSDGSYLGDSLFNGCGSGNTYDSACLDAYAQASLGPGTYTLALTQSGNNANSEAGFPGDLSYGFSEQGLGDYTPSTTDDPDCSAFCGTLGTQENGNWAVDILNATSAVAVSATPEPATFLPAGFGLFLAALAMRRRLHKK
jgi:hypothetical protein